MAEVHSSCASRHLLCNFPLASAGKFIGSHDEHVLSSHLRRATIFKSHFFFWWKIFWLRSPTAVISTCAFWKIGCPADCPTRPKWTTNRRSGWRFPNDPCGTRRGEAEDFTDGNMDAGPPVRSWFILHALWCNSRFTWVFLKVGTPKVMDGLLLLSMINQLDDLGVPAFLRNHHIVSYS